VTLAFYEAKKIKLDIYIERYFEQPDFFSVNDEHTRMDFLHKWNKCVPPQGYRHHTILFITIKKRFGCPRSTSSTSCCLTFFSNIFVHLCIHGAHECVHVYGVQSFLTSLMNSLLLLYITPHSPQVADAFPREGG